METERIDLDNGYTCVIEQDVDASNPRDDDNLGKILCFHRRYNLGDDHGIQEGDFDGWSELHQYLIDEEDAVITSPVYMYDHSGLALSASAFGCRFDSGQVGFTYISKDTLIKEYGSDTHGNRMKAEKVMLAELTIYGHFVSGDAYGFRVLGPGSREVDSCWSFFGPDHEASGLLERARDTAAAALAAENENFLVGMKCPSCKSKGPFQINCSGLMLVYDDGTEPAEGSDTDWDSESYCRCPACKKVGLVADFKLKATEV